MPPPVISVNNHMTCHVSEPNTFETRTYVTIGIPAADGTNNMIIILIICDVERFNKNNNNKTHTLLECVGTCIIFRWKKNGRQYNICA